MKNVKEKDGLTTFGRANAEFLYSFNLAPEGVLLPYLEKFKQNVLELYSDQAALYVDPEDTLRRDHALHMLRSLIQQRVMAYEIDVLMEVTQELNTLAKKEPEWR